MPFRTLINSDTLSTHLGDPSWVVVDCRFKLDDPAWGAREYAARHIPGAIYADLDRDLSGEKNGRNGRHPLPAPGSLAKTLGNFGIDETVQVVTYDQDSGMYASRLWWMLRWMGHEDVAVLDGGFTGWLTDGRPVTAGVEARGARRFKDRPRPEMIVSVDEVASRIRQPDWLLVDARAPERFSGRMETIDKKAGHIPGATNQFFKWNVDENNRLRDRDTLRDRWDRALSGVPADHVVCYCGSGVTACQNLLTLEHIGLSGARLYPGSWSEWSSDPARGVATD
jgi:thiosulfate/3-mercaptopyruvate sulfurtransferase